MKQFTKPFILVLICSICISMQSFAQTTSPDSTLKVKQLSQLKSTSSSGVFSSSSFPALKTTRYYTGTSGAFNSISGIGSGMFLVTQNTNNTISDGYGGGFVFGLRDTNDTDDMVVGRIYCRRDGKSGIHHLGAMQFWVGNYGKDLAMTIRANKYVGIGTSDPQAELDVNGTLKANQIEVSLAKLDHMQLDGTLAANKIVYKVNGNTADFVFKQNYKLKTLNEVDDFIKKHKHLPGIPSATSMEENGVSVAEINKLLLQKVEEITLYLIKQEKENEKLKKQLNDQKNQINALTNADL